MTEKFSSVFSNRVALRRNASVSVREGPESEESVVIQGWRCAWQAAANVTSENELRVLPAVLEVVAPHPVLALQVADDRLDRGAAIHLASDGCRGSSNLAGDPDPEFMGNGCGRGSACRYGCA